MNLARSRGEQLRRELRLKGPVDAEAVADLLIDGREAVERGLTEPWEMAEHFGVPEELVRLHAPHGRWNASRAEPGAP